MPDGRSRCFLLQHAGRLLVNGQTGCRRGLRRGYQTQSCCFALLYLPALMPSVAVSRFFMAYAFREWHCCLRAMALVADDDMGVVFRQTSISPADSAATCAVYLRVPS